MLNRRIVDMIVLSMGLIQFAIAQNLAVTNYTFERSGNVSFNLFVDPSHSARERYDLLIYSSADNFEKPLKYSPKNLEANTLHRLGFDANQQVGSFNGPLQFRMDIQASIFPLKPNVEANAGLKKGKVPNLTWQDYIQVAPYQVELYKGGNLIQIIEESTDTTYVQHALLNDLEKGSGYEIRISSLSNPQMNSDLIPVVIKSKLGLGVKLFPVAVLGAGAAYLLLNQEVTPGEEAEGFVDPPGEPGN